MRTLHKHPGKYEGNESELMARVIDTIIGNGFATDEFGDVSEGGHCALVMGRRYGFIAVTDNHGFVTVHAYPSPEAALKLFNELIPTQEEGE